jgi:hypothetical protein
MKTIQSHFISPNGPGVQVWLPEKDWKFLGAAFNKNSYGVDLYVMMDQFANLCTPVFFHILREQDAVMDNYEFVTMIRGSAECGLSGNPIEETFFVFKET